MKKIVMGILIAMLCLVFAACGTSQKPNSETEKTKSEQASEEKASKSSSSESSSAKKKYRNITAETTPIGVDGIKFVVEDGYVYMHFNLYKNSSDIEESTVAVTFEILDENEEYLGKCTVETERTMVDGDIQKLKQNITSNKEYTEEVLAKWKANVIDIKETDSLEAAKAEEFLRALNDIDWDIRYDEEYNSGLMKLEKVKEEYPEYSDEIELFEAELKDYLINEGISVEGFTTSGESSAASADEESADTANETEENGTATE